MPVNESTVTRYFNAVDNAHSQITVAEINRAQNDPAQSADMLAELGLVSPTTHQLLQQLKDNF